jgi:uroporphyrinogen III methyltransferase/synthase
MKAAGRVFLVGAGPGDVGLLTLRGAELLQQADVVIYDGLVNPALLQLAAHQAEIIYGGKHDRTRVVSQEALNALLVAKACEGKTVVRLKGGDPYVFGRGGEEAEKLAEAGIPFEVVPGVSSVAAVPNYAGIPLTHRDYCSSYTVVTGHENATRKEARLRWKDIAKIPGTLVILMGLKNLPVITRLLVKHGRRPETPAALIRWGTTGRQQVLVGSLATLAGKAQKANFLPPAVTIIGEVVKLRSKLNWFEKRPLAGQCVVVTQPQGQNAALGRLLRAHGAEVMEVPVMKVTEPTDRQSLLQALAHLNRYDWIILSSPASVTAFFDFFFQLHRDWRDLGTVHLCAYGPKTADKLRELHLSVDALPQEHLGHSIAKALSRKGNIQGQKILLLRPERASSKVPEYLRARGAMVEDITCYRSVVETADVTGGAAQLLANGAEWITFAGYPEVGYFHARFDLCKLVKQFPHMKLATIGPKTSRLLTQLGLTPAAEAVTPTLEALVSALERNVSGHRCVRGGKAVQEGICARADERRLGEAVASSHPAHLAVRPVGDSHD